MPRPLPAHPLLCLLPALLRRARPPARPAAGAEVTRGAEGEPPQKRARVEAAGSGPGPGAEAGVAGAGLLAGPALDVDWGDIHFGFEDILVDNIGLELGSAPSMPSAPNPAAAPPAAAAAGAGPSAPPPGSPVRFASNLYNILTVNSIRSDEVDRIIDEVVTRQWSMSHVVPAVRTPSGEELRRVGSAAGNVRIEAYGEMLALVHAFLDSFEREWDALAAEGSVAGDGSESEAEGEAARMECVVPFQRAVALAERELDLAAAGMALDAHATAFLRDRAGCGDSDALGNGHFYCLWRWLFFAGRFRRAAGELWTDRARIAGGEVSFLSNALKARDHVEALLAPCPVGTYLLRLSSKAFPSPNAACVVISSVLAAGRPGAGPRFEHFLLNIRDCASRESVLKVINERRGTLIWMWPSGPAANADTGGVYNFVEQP
eukprot:tig00001406_g8594.t1